MPGVITLTIKVITPFMPVSYLFHKLKSGHPNLYHIKYVINIIFQCVSWRDKLASSAKQLQMRSLALSAVGEFEKERTRLGPKSDFFLA